uniref:Uncharacterized protein n=1 Tax=Zea mays TaxID=4577 RepID=C4IZI8_MAIZE|nr:unknown [Zea mays]
MKSMRCCRCRCMPNNSNPEDASFRSINREHSSHLRSFKALCRSRRNWAKARSETPSLVRKPTGSMASPRPPGRCLGGRSRGADEEEDELQRNG